MIEVGTISDGKIQVYNKASVRESCNTLYLLLPKSNKKHTNTLRLLSTVNSTVFKSGQFNSNFDYLYLRTV